jgi:hypothetical protein
MMTREYYGVLDRWLGEVGKVGNEDEVRKEKGRRLKQKIKHRPKSLTMTILEWRVGRGSPDEACQDKSWE